MLPLGHCIVCREICWIAPKERPSIVITREGYMHKLCYIYKGKRLIKREERPAGNGRFNAYNREKQAWV